MKRCTKTMGEVNKFFKDALSKGNARLEQLGMIHSHDKWDAYDSMHRSMSLERDKVIEIILKNDLPKRKVSRKGKK